MNNEKEFVTYQMLEDAYNNLTDGLITIDGYDNLVRIFNQQKEAARKQKRIDAAHSRNIKVLVDNQDGIVLRRDFTRKFISPNDDWTEYATDTGEQITYEAETSAEDIIDATEAGTDFNTTKNTKGFIHAIQNPDGTIYDNKGNTYKIENYDKTEAPSQPIQIELRNAREIWINYDHPEVKAFFAEEELNHLPDKEP